MGTKVCSIAFFVFQPSLGMPSPSSQDISLTTFLPSFLRYLVSKCYAKAGKCLQMRHKRNLMKFKKTCSSGRKKTNLLQVNWKQVKQKNLLVVVVEIIRASCMPLCPEYFY